jgi:hypothetical protein
VSQQAVEAPPRQAEEHQLGQAALVSLIPRLLREAWPLLDLHNLQATMPQFTAAVRAIVQRYGRASSAAALTYYKAERAAASVSGRPVSKLAPTPADSVIEAAVSWATTDLYGPVTPQTTEAALTRLDESVSQLVLNQGRDTIIGAVQQDKYARAWVRVTSPGACSFCQMLALRGAVYKDARAAGKGSRGASGKAFAGGGLDFKVHDNCRCHAEPVFTAYEPSARMREMQKTWDESTKGRSGADARNAFRQALEGRPVTGTTGGKKAKVLLGKSSMDRAQAEFLLKQAQGMKDSPWRTKQIARLSKLLAGK